jgi:hypothetical protein
MRVFLETWLLVSLAGAALAFLLPAQYQSEARLQGGSAAQVAETITAGATRDTIEGVVDQFGLIAGAPDSASRERTIAVARSQTRLEVVDGMGLRVAFTSSDPDLSQRVTQRLAERLIDGITSKPPAGDKGMLDAELAQVSELLAARRMSPIRRRSWRIHLEPSATPRRRLDSWARPSSAIASSCAWPGPML